MALSSNRPSWRPCCAWDGNHDPDIPDDTPDPMNHPWMEDLRRHMLSGSPHPGCGECYGYEAAQGYSMRQQFNDERGRLLAPRLAYLELNFGNLCNLKCRMCNSNSSSRWIADDPLLNRDQNPLVRRAATAVGADLSSLDMLKIIGGEPSLEQDGIRDVLGRIRAARGGLGHLRVEIFTNGMVLFDDDVIGMLLECGHAVMQLSLDGLRTCNDYQRTGSDWDTVVATARKYHDLVRPGFGLCMATTIGMFTVAGATEFVDWVSAELPLSKHIVQMIHMPRPQSVRNLPLPYKEVLLDRVMRWRPRENVQPGWLEYGPTIPDRIRDLLEYSLRQESNMPLSVVRDHAALLDAINGGSLRDTLPELHAALHA